MTTTTIPGNDPARILIYGQCPLLTSALSDLLSEQMAGSECVRVHDQEEAMARLHKKAFSLVVIDLDGGDGGVLLLRDVKALEKAPRCIVLITDGSQPALMSAIRMQADGFISKKLPVPQLTTQLTMSAGGELVISDSLTAALALALGANLLRTACCPAGKIIGLDRGYALEMICGSEVTVEYDKLIDRQLERAAITSISGFAKIFQDAAKVLKLGG